MNTFKEPVERVHPGPKRAAAAALWVGGSTTAAIHRIAAGGGERSGVGEGRGDSFIY